MEGYVHIYTGDGKGKTTAALGLALRAAGAGLRVYIAQFIKSMEYSEVYTLKCLKDKITIRQYGRGCFIWGEPCDEDIAAARYALSDLTGILSSGQYDVVIADEINVAFQCKLISEDDLLILMESRPKGVELVLTGRGAPSQIIEKADLVTEMKPVKHYFEKGIMARKGIES